MIDYEPVMNFPIVKELIIKGTQKSIDCNRLVGLDLIIDIVFE